MTRSNNATWTMPSACRRTRAWSWRSRIFCFVYRDGRAVRPWCATRVFAIRRRAGLHPDGIVAKVEHHRGELFPRVGFIVTSMVLPSRSVVRFYNTRGTAEQWIKEGKQATHWTRLSCHRFRANEVRLQLSVLAYNLGNLWRRLILPPGDQALVADESPAAAGENRRPAGEARQILLAPAGGRASEPAALRRDAAEDLGAAGAGRLTRGRVQRRLAKKGHKCGAVSEKCPESSGSGRFHVSVG